MKNVIEGYLLASEGWGVTTKIEGWGGTVIEGYAG